MSSTAEQGSSLSTHSQVPGSRNTPKVIVDDAKDSDPPREPTNPPRRSSSLNPISWWAGRKSPAPDSNNAATRRGLEASQESSRKSMLGDSEQEVYHDGRKQRRLSASFYDNDDTRSTRESSGRAGFGASVYGFLGLTKPTSEKRPLPGSGESPEILRGDSQGARPKNRTQFTESTKLDIDDIGQDDYPRPTTWGELVTQLAPLPPFVAIIESLQFIFDAAGTIKTNKAHWRGLRNQCVFTSLVVAFQYQKYKDDPKNQRFISQVCGDVAETIRDIEKSALKWSNRSPIVAFAQFEKMSDDIHLSIRRLEAARRTLEASLFEWILQTLTPWLCMLQTSARVLSEALVNEMAEKQRLELKEIKALHESIKRQTGALEQLSQLNDPNQRREIIEEEVRAALQREMSSLNRSQGDNEDIGKAIDFIVSLTGVQVPMEVFHKKVCTNVSAEPISRTPTCTVYTATFVGEQLVAKKLLELGKYSEGDVTTYAEKVCRDVQEWQKFDSKYTLPCLGIGMERFGDGAFKMYMVSPYIENKDAMTYLKNLRTLKGDRVTLEIDKKDILRIVQGAALGLVEVHQHGSVHSNMRGDNVLVGSDGMGILGGFGLTKARPNCGGKLAAVEQTGMNPPYRWMAPECVNPSKGKPEVTQANDVWGWAMTTLQVITGVIPIRIITNDMWLFSGTQSHFYIKRQEYPEFELFAHQPDEMWSLLEKCWDREPKNRPTIQIVAEQLGRIISMP